MSSGRPLPIRRLAIITMVHISLVLGLIFMSLLPACRTTAQPPMPAIDLVVEVPPGTEDGTDDFDPKDPAPPPSRVEPDEEEQAVVQKVAEKKTVAKPDQANKEKQDGKDARKPAKVPKEASTASATNSRGTQSIARSTVRVKRPFGTADGKIPKKPMSAKEVKDRLLAGFKPGDHTTEVDDDTLYRQLIRNQLYKAWAQPSSIDVAGLKAKVELELGAGGRVLSSRIAVPSGNAVMDDSVQRALSSVTRFPSLPDTFIDKCRRITVTFELTGEANL